MSRHVTPRVRAIVLERDGYTCQRCAVYIGPFGTYSLQHRRPRGMGGSRRPETNLPGNLITLCGTATTGCHEYVESHRHDAHLTGYLLPQSVAFPALEPVKTYRGWLLLSDDGSYTTLEGAPQ